MINTIPKMQPARQQLSYYRRWLPARMSFIVSQPAVFLSRRIHDDRGRIRRLRLLPLHRRADTIADRLSALFGQRPSGRDVFASAYTHKLRLVDYSGKVSKLSAQSYNSAEEATKAADGSLVNDQAPDATVWQAGSDSSRSPGILYRNTLRPDALQYIDLGAFRDIYLHHHRPAG